MGGVQAAHTSGVILVRLRRRTSWRPTSDESVKATALVTDAPRTCASRWRSPASSPRRPPASTLELAKALQANNLMVRDNTVVPRPQNVDVPKANMTRRRTSHGGQRRESAADAHHFAAKAHPHINAEWVWLSVPRSVAQGRRPRRMWDEYCRHNTTSHRRRV